MIFGWVLSLQRVVVVVVVVMVMVVIAASNACIRPSGYCGLRRIWEDRHYEGVEAKYMEGRLYIRRPNADWGARVGSKSLGSLSPFGF